MAHWAELEQVVALSLQLDCSEGSTFPASDSAGIPCMCSLNQSVSCDGTDVSDLRVIHYCGSFRCPRGPESHSHVVAFCFFIFFYLLLCSLLRPCWTSNGHEPAG